MISVLCATALSLAGSADLSIERGWLALDEERLEAARGFALKAIEEDPKDWHVYELYVEVDRASGMPERAIGDLSSLASGGDRLAELMNAWATADTEATIFSAPPPEHETLATYLRADLALASEPKKALELLEGVAMAEASGARVAALHALGDDRAAAAEALAHVSAWPTRLDLLVPLWDGANQEPAMQKARGKVLKTMRKALAKNPDPLVAFHARELLVAAQEPDAQAAIDKLVHAGETASILTVQLTPAERRVEARHRVSASDMTLPRGRTSDRIDIAVRMAAQLNKVKSHALEVELLSNLRQSEDDARASRAHAVAIMSATGLEAARPVFDEALVAASGPALDDVHRRDIPARQVEMALTLAARGKALHQGAYDAEAIVDLTIAYTLDQADTTVHKDTYLKVQKVVGRMEQLKHKYKRGGATPVDAALKKGLKALEEGRNAEAVEVANDALMMITATGASQRLAKSAFSGEMAIAQTIRAEALRKLDKPDQALVAMTIASVLNPYQLTAEQAVLLAELQEAAGHTDAAFASYAIAESLGAEVAEAVARTYSGCATHEAAASAIVAKWVAEKEAAKVAVAEGEGMKITRLAGKRVSLGSRGRGSRRAGPIIGATVADWGVGTETGVISSAIMNGRITVISFWASWCEPCLRELPAMSKMVRKLHGSGVGVEILAISTDEDRKAYDTVRKQLDLKGLNVGHDPNFAKRWGIKKLPNTWVIDKRGKARYHHVGYSGSTSRLEREIRGLN